MRRAYNYVPEDRFAVAGPVGNAVLCPMEGSEMGLFGKNGSEPTPWRSSGTDLIIALRRAQAIQLQAQEISMRGQAISMQAKEMSMQAQANAAGRGSAAGIGERRGPRP